jgi:hypothetical protein
VRSCARVKEARRIPAPEYHRRMLATLAWTLVIAGSPATKLQPEVGKEMTAAIVAINKVLGLESWTLEGEESCVDRGGLEATAKDVSADDARRCAASAIEKGFPNLGKAYTVGIPMAGIGPVTVFAIGQDSAEGWGAYSCDPSRKCGPTRLDAGSKQAKRLAERRRRACESPKTLWFPSRDAVCAGIPMSSVPEPSPAPAPSKSPAAKPAPSGSSTPAPWPVKE